MQQRYRGKIYGVIALNVLLVYVHTYNYALTYIQNKVHLLLLQSQLVLKTVSYTI
jgi:hypothetical protein